MFLGYPALYTCFGYLALYTLFGYHALYTFFITLPILYLFLGYFALYHFLVTLHCTHFLITCVQCTCFLVTLHCTCFLVISHCTHISWLPCIVHIPWLPCIVHISWLPCTVYFSWLPYIVHILWLPRTSVQAWRSVGLELLQSVHLLWQVVNLRPQCCVGLLQFINLGAGKRNEHTWKLLCSLSQVLNCHTDWQPSLPLQIFFFLYMVTWCSVILCAVMQRCGQNAQGTPKMQCLCKMVLSPKFRVNIAMSMTPVIIFTEQCFTG